MTFSLSPFVPFLSFGVLYCPSFYNEYSLPLKSEKCCTRMDQHKHAPGNKGLTSCLMGNSGRTGKMKAGEDEMDSPSVEEG